MRAKKADQSDIFFVDHGDMEWVPDYIVQHIHPSLLEVMNVHSAYSIDYVITTYSSAPLVTCSSY